MRLCFISYARNNNIDGRLTRFVRALEEQLLQHLPSGTRREDVSFFDVQSIDSADQWMDRLAEATRTCKVFVCFYSTPYFTSEYCGREVTVFLQRLKAWKQLPDSAGSATRALIPVIWTSENVPTVLQPFQKANADYPTHYLNEGLLALAMRKNRRDAYNSVLILLARRIAHVLRGLPPLPIGDAIASFDAVSSAFHAQPVPMRYGIAWADLTTPAIRRRPFNDSTSALDSQLTQWAGEVDAPLRELAVNERLATAVAQSAAEREMVVLMFARETIESTYNAPLLAALNSVFDAGSATVVLISDGQSGAADALTAHMARWSRLMATGASLLVGDSASLATGLRGRLMKLRRELIQADPARRAEDPTLEKAAAEAGIALGVRPILVGPGR